MAALDVIRNANPDVVILDWTLPVISGPQVIRIVRDPACSRSRICRSSC